MKRLAADPRLAQKRFFSLMSTFHTDLDFLADLIELNQAHIVVPFFGIHPWYCHLYSVNGVSKAEHYNLVLSNFSEDLLQVLPDPIPLEDHMARIRGLIARCLDLGMPYAVGEIGLDGLFSIPSNGFYGNQSFEGPVSLTKCKTRMEHQKHVFRAFLLLAEQLRRPVSLHCVKSHGSFFDILKDSYLDIPALVLHSFTGSKEQAQRWINVTKKQERHLLFSFSHYINNTASKVETLGHLLQMLDDNQILVESDLPIDKYFMENRHDEYFEHLASITTQISQSKAWSEAHAAATLHSNAYNLFSR